jgi:hypothetical protein
MEDNLFKGSDSKLIQCHPNNVNNFSRQFLDDVKTVGQGPYVKALKDVRPYTVRFPSKMDSVNIVSNPHESGDVEFSIDNNYSERLYRYVEEKTIRGDGKEGKLITLLDWTATGKADLVKAMKVVEEAEKLHREKNDKVLAILLGMMSVESISLLENYPGFTEAKDKSDLWTIFNVLLKQSHNVTSSSAIQRRAAEFLGSTQSGPYSAYIAT